jgi:hypothetical protein
MQFPTLNKSLSRKSPKTTQLPYKVTEAGMVRPCFFSNIKGLNIYQPCYLTLKTMGSQNNGKQWGQSN